MIRHIVSKFSNSYYDNLRDLLQLLLHTNVQETMPERAVYLCCRRLYLLLIVYASLCIYRLNICNIDRAFQKPVNLLQIAWGDCEFCFIYLKAFNNFVVVCAGSKKFLYQFRVLS